eukprot:SAG31_NODE_937_length_10886_cov_3.648651_1_plen_281_part_00
MIVAAGMHPHFNLPEPEPESEERAAQPHGAGAHADQPRQAGAGAAPAQQWRPRAMSKSRRRSITLEVAVDAESTAQAALMTTSTNLEGSSAARSAACIASARVGGDDDGILGADLMEQTRTELPSQPQRQNAVKLQDYLTSFIEREVWELEEVQERSVLSQFSNRDNTVETFVDQLFIRELLKANKMLKIWHSNEAELTKMESNAVSKMEQSVTSSVSIGDKVLIRGSGDRRYDGQLAQVTAIPAVSHDDAQTYRINFLDPILAERSESRRFHNSIMQNL